MFSKMLLRLLAIGLILLSLGGCSEYLVNKYAFHPVSFQTKDYEITDNRIQEFVFATQHNSSLHAFYIPYPGKQKLVIFFHGNSGNSLQRLLTAWDLAKTGVNVMLVSYRGYGRNLGTPSEKGIYEDAAAAVNFARLQLGYPEADIFILGRSLGTAVAIDVAQDRAFGGLILISPFPSGQDVLIAGGANLLGQLIGDTPFNSITKLSRINAPALFIFGDRDTLIPGRLSRKLYDLYPSAYKNISVVLGADHNDILDVSGPRLWDRIEAFISAPEQHSSQETSL